MKKYILLFFIGIFSVLSGCHEKPLSLDRTLIPEEFRWGMTPEEVLSQNPSYTQYKSEIRGIYHFGGHEADILLAFATGTNGAGQLFSMDLIFRDPWIPAQLKEFLTELYGSPIEYSKAMFILGVSEGNYWFSEQLLKDRIDAEQNTEVINSMQKVFGGGNRERLQSQVNELPLVYMYASDDGMNVRWNGLWYLYSEGIPLDHLLWAE